MRSEQEFVKQKRFPARRTLSLCLSGLALFFLSACMDVRPLQRHIESDTREINTALQEIEPKGRRTGHLQMDDRPWFGSMAVPIQNGRPLPSHLAQPGSLVLTFEKPLTLREMGRALQASSGIRVTVEDLAEPEDPDSPSAVSGFIPSDGVEVAGGRMVWHGRLPDLLDQVSDHFDADWHYDGATLRLSREVTRTFMLHALAGNIQYGGSLTSESEGALPQIDFSSNTTLEIWGEISESISSMLGDRGRATYSPSTGTITVTAPPSLSTRIESYLREQNRMRLRRVAVAVKVLSLETRNINEVTFNLGAILERAIRGKPFELKAVTGGLTAGILRSVPNVDAVSGFTNPPEGADVVKADSDTIAALLEASEEIDKATVVQSGAVVTLSDIPAPLQIGRVITYLASVRTTVSDGVSSTSLTPGEINTGLTMNVLPRVIEKNRVLLRLAIGIMEAQRPFSSFSSGAQTIQLPEIETTGFMQNAVLESGETLVLAGFERNQAGISDQGVPGGLMTGGNRRASQSRTVTVLLITTELLPEDPLSVLSR